MKHHAIKTGPIQKNLFSDPYAPKITIDRGYTLFVNKLYVYDEIKVGARPKYEVICKDYKKVINKAHIICDAFNLKSTFIPFTASVSSDMLDFYEDVKVINVETGEFIE